MNQRVRRVNESIIQILADLVPGLKDPRIGFVTLTEVRTSTDLRHAEVFYTVLEDDPERRQATADGLASATPMLRRELGARLRLRHVPELVFTSDPLPAQGRRIEELLRQVDSTGASDRHTGHQHGDDDGDR